MKLLLTGAFNYSEEQKILLTSLGYEAIFIQDERIPLKIDVASIDVVVCNNLFLYNDIKKFENLKYIQLTSAGLDRVPLNYIKEQEISLSNAKGVYSIPMAEWVVLKILEIYKKSRQFYEAQNQYKWEKQRDILELTNKTVAIVGYGDVGVEVAKRLKSFGTHIIGVGRRNLETEYLDEFYLIDQLDEVLKKSDIVILTLTLTKETNNLIGSERIELMKNNSVLINVSRGGVIDESALLTALRSEKFLGVALDVFQDEPLRENNPLWDFNKLIITPHNSFVSDITSERLFTLIKHNLSEFIQWKD